MRSLPAGSNARPHPSEMSTDVCGRGTVPHHEDHADRQNFSLEQAMLHKVEVVRRTRLTERRLTKCGVRLVQRLALISCYGAATVITL